MMNTSSIAKLTNAIARYLAWMSDNGYSSATRQNHGRSLREFISFVERKAFAWEVVFTPETLRVFKAECKTTYAACSVIALSKYLCEQGEIPQAIKRSNRTLPAVYEEYIRHYERVQRIGESRIEQTRRILCALDEYLSRAHIKLGKINIEHIDAFLAEHNKDLGSKSAANYRSCLKGFLRWLHQVKQVFTRDLAALIVSAPSYGRSKPPRFLRPNEMRTLFEVEAKQQDLSALKLRNRAILYLAVALGLRPIEISLIALDDVHFSEAEISLPNRKNDEHLALPLPEYAIKAIAAYIVGGRPQSKHRRLFLSVHTPFGPLPAPQVSKCISRLVHKANSKASAYWLRHTYAQNLLESGASIFEIKTMLGHEKIESTGRYIHIHLSLMRKVLFDETL